jgi:hypothetical protein
MRNEQNIVSPSHRRSFPGLSLLRSASLALPSVLERSTAMKRKDVQQYANRPSFHKQMHTRACSSYALAASISVS